MKLASVFALTVTTLMSSISLAESPIYGEAVPTAFACEVTLTQSGGGNYKQEVRVINELVNTDFEKTISLSQLFKLSPGLTGGFISLSAVDYKGQGRLQRRKFASLYVRTPSLNVHGTFIYGDGDDSSKKIDGKALIANTRVSTYNAKVRGGGDSVSVKASCSMREL